MSVIIRLQNLPWSANAGDIRTYFNGLSIPEGGVHIIGGEQGDAFIAFSTDEDARQAMLKDNGKLKEVKIKLFLSSRTEMLRVIEQARQQAMKIHNLMHVPSISPMNAQPKPVGSEQNPVVSEELKGKDENNKRDKRTRSRSRGRSRARGSSHDQSRSRSRRDRDRRRRDRSHSRSRSRSRDRHRSRRSRSKDRKRNSRDRDSKDNRNKSRDNRNNRQDKDVNNQDWNQPPQKLPDPPAIPPKLLQMHQNGKEPSPSNLGMPFPFPNQMGSIMPPFPPMQQIRPREWGTMPMPPIIDPMQRAALMPTPEMAMPNFPTGFPLNPPIFQTPNMSEHPPYDAMWRFNQMPNKEQSNDDVPETSDLCIEVRGLPLNVSYIDVKKLFDGLSIPSDGIKMINDTHGYRTGIAYVKFSNSNHKKSALNQNGKKVRSNIVEVLHLRDAIYTTAVDNFKPDKESILNNDDMDIDSSDQNEEKWSHSKAMNVNPSRSLLPPRTDYSSRKTDEEPKSNWVILRGLPLGSNERDVYDFFSQKSLSPVQVFFAQNNFGFSDAYCRFISLDDTDKAMSVSNPIMGRIPFTIVRTTREDAERHDANKFHTQNRMNRPFRQGVNPQPFAPRPNLNDSNGQNQRPWRFPPNDDTRFKKNSFNDNRFKEPRNDFVGRGGMGARGLPRRFPGPNIEPMGNGPRFMGPRMNQREQGPPYIDNDLLEGFGSRGCVVELKNIHFKADVDEIMEFFNGYTLEQEDVIRRFDERGRATGDARVALKTQADAVRAVKELNFRLLRGRSVKVNLLQN